MQRHKPYAAAHSTHAQLLHTVGQNSWQVRHECSPFCQRSQHSHTGVSHIEVLFSVGPPPASLSQVSPNSNLPNPHIPAFSNTSPGRAQVTGCHSQICKRGAATHHRQLPDTPSAPPTSHTHTECMWFIMHPLCIHTDWVRLTHPGLHRSRLHVVAVCQTAHTLLKGIAQTDTQVGKC